MSTQMHIRAKNGPKKTHEWTKKTHPCTAKDANSHEKWTQKWTHMTQQMSQKIQIAYAN